MSIRRGILPDYTPPEIHAMTGHLPSSGGEQSRAGRPANSLGRLGRRINASDRYGGSETSAPVSVRTVASGSVPRATTTVVPASHTERGAAESPSTLPGRVPLGVYSPVGFRSSRSRS